ncbi:hypothetical protein Tco_0567065 [Tanacetum coccineum]
MATMARRCRACSDGSSTPLEDFSYSAAQSENGGVTNRESEAVKKEKVLDTLKASEIVGGGVDAEWTSSNRDAAEHASPFLHTGWLIVAPSSILRRLIVAPSLLSLGDL